MWSRSESIVVNVAMKGKDRLRSWILKNGDHQNGSICQQWIGQGGQYLLVGGWTTHLKKYARQIGSFLREGVKIKKYLKPPTSYFCTVLTPKFLTICHGVNPWTIILIILFPLWHGIMSFVEKKTRSKATITLFNQKKQLATIATYINIYHLIYPLTSI